MKKNLQNTTTDALLYHLGYDTPRPIMRSVLATALDMLKPEAKADVIQYLTAYQLESPAHDGSIHNPGCHCDTCDPDTRDLDDGC